MAAAPQPIDVYYWPTPNGWKITIMLEECGLPYRAIPVDIGAGPEPLLAFIRDGLARAKRDGPP